MARVATSRCACSAFFVAVSHVLASYARLWVVLESPTYSLLLPEPHDRQKCQELPLTTSGTYHFSFKRNIAMGKIYRVLQLLCNPSHHCRPSRLSWVALPEPSRRKCPWMAATLKSKLRMKQHPYLLVHVGPHEYISTKILHGKVKLNLPDRHVGHVCLLLLEALATLVAEKVVRAAVVRSPNVTE